MSNDPRRDPSPADVDESLADLDLNGDGRIQFSEFIALLDRVGSRISLDQRRRQFASIDRNGDGYVDRRELLAWLRDG